MMLLLTAYLALTGGLTLLLVLVMAGQRLARVRVRRPVERRRRDVPVPAERRRRGTLAEHH